MLITVNNYGIPLLTEYTLFRLKARFLHMASMIRARDLQGVGAIARLKGGLRNVANVTRLAQLFAGTANPTPAHLKAAIQDMKLAPRGTKL
ncbi:MAG: hypothetical protein COB16_16445 [Rhodobacteraceae bacterium]|nr:MAG: hypothetical protein COB16_16445 [Paracoccaceae bacterium]